MTRLLERDESGHSLELEVAAQAEEDEFIVFDDAPWVTPETLPEESAEALGLEQKGYALRRFPFSSIRIVPSNNPRSRTERAGIVRLARNIARRGLQQPVTGRHDASRCLETLNTLLNLAKSDLERLHRLLVATMIGDFVAATDGSFQERKRSLKVNGVIAGLAAHLGVKGGEAWEINEEYLKTISFPKARLEPYLAAALGEMLAQALMDNPKAKIIAEVLTHKAKIPIDFTPPELEFSRHANPVAVKLEVAQDDFDDELEELGKQVGLISEDDVRLATAFDPDQNEAEVAAD